MRQPAVPFTDHETVIEGLSPDEIATATSTQQTAKRLICRSNESTVVRQKSGQLQTAVQCAALTVIENMLLSRV